MKKMVALLSMLVASWAMAHGQLFPIGHTMCLNPEQYSMMQVCTENKQFVVGDDGRCGCLASSEYHNTDTCMAARIICEETAPYTSLFRMNIVDGTVEKTYEGCGCFTTDDGMHATSAK